MKDSEIKVGDVLRIRQWDDMLSEFDLTDSGSIRGCCDVFTKSMRRLCGQIFTVKLINDVYAYTHYYSYEGSELTRDDGYDSEWWIHAWMLEPYNGKSIQQPSTTEVSSLLSL